MAYDPYTDPYSGYDPYTDPYSGYGPYGWDEQAQYSDSPPPVPDKNWEDPAKINRAYLKKIQKCCVKEEFRRLEEVGLFLLEVSVNSIILKNDADKQVSTDTNEESFTTEVKMLNFPFIKASGWSEEDKIGRAEDVALYSQLFQTVFTETGRHVTLLSEESGKIESADKPKESLREPEINEQSPAMKVEVMKGKSVLIPMTGFEMIQSLQQYPVEVRVSQRENSEDEEQVKIRLIGTSRSQLPERFPYAVLWSSMHEALMPSVAVQNGYYPLVDSEGQSPADVNLTIVLTCFGKGMVNCVRETVEGDQEFENTTLLTSLQYKPVKHDFSSINPQLAKEILKMGPITPTFKTSSEILKICLSSNLISVDEGERRHVLKRDGCYWHAMVEEAISTVSLNSVDSTLHAQMEEKDTMAKLWRKHKKICQEMRAKEGKDQKRSLLNRLEVLQIQSGLAIPEVKNPIEEEAKHSSILTHSEASSQKSHRKSSRSGSARS